ncbi:ribosomal protein S2, flavodoxin-like domain-containing protein, partial [Paraphysoderma sedebokerense]
NLTVSDLLQAQLHLGHQASRWNPQMLPYIFGKRHNLHIINLEQTLSAIRRACNFVRSVAYHDGIILFAAKNPYLHSIATSSALESQQYYIHNWTAGTLTNTSEIVAKNGETEIHKPDVLILLDAKDNMKAVKEARKVNVPTIALVDTDMDPRWISFPIPGNDEGVKGIELVSRVLSVAAREGVEKRLAEKKRS